MISAQPILAKPKKRNPYISYLKGVAIFAILIIHLVNWSNLGFSQKVFWPQELLQASVFIFIFTVGSVAYLAYKDYDNLKIPTKRLLIRGLQLIGIYFLYSVIKFFIFNFKTEPYYAASIPRSAFNLISILSLRAYVVPISIILTIGVYLIISPIFLLISKKTKYPKFIIAGLLILFLIINYLVKLPANPVTDFLYARGNITFPLMLWIVPYLAGFYLMMIGLERHKKWLLLVFFLITLGYYFYLPHNRFLHPSWAMYPLKPYYMVVCLMLVYLVIWLFYFLEQLTKVLGLKTSKIIKYFLAAIRVAGDSTLFIYIFQWILIDLTIWIFYPAVAVILVTVPLLLVGFFIAKRSRMKKYAAECANG